MKIVKINKRGLNELPVDIAELIKRKLEGNTLTNDEFLKVHFYMIANNKEYCKNVSKLMTSDLKKMHLYKTTTIKYRSNEFFDLYDSFKIEIEEAFSEYGWDDDIEEVEESLLDMILEYDLDEEGIVFFKQAVELRVENFNMDR